MDFVVGLPESEGFNAIWVVVDRLTKMRHLVPCTDTVDGKKLGEMYVKEIFRLHGLPETIVSDRGPQFASEFWRHICERLGVERRLSTAFHPQTDGQTERVNAVMEQYLRNFVNYQQNDWVHWLPMAEFAANNHTSETTGHSPFYGNYGFHPRMTFGQHPLQDPKDVREVNAQQTAQRMEQLFSELKAEMKRSQAIHSEQANKSRRTGTELNVGDHVWLDARNISTTRPSKKLDWKRIGPYEITEVISPWAFRIKLPHQLHIHDVQPISRLEKTAVNPLPLQQNEPPPPVIVEGEEEYEVEKVEDSRVFRRQLQYLVKWKGYDEMSWKPAVNVDGLKAIDEFHTQQPGKPGS
jgi:hypothetical protein